MGQTTDPGVPFGEQLRSLREARAWSLRDLAHQINFHRGYIGRVEQGARFPSRTLAELADRALESDGALVEAWDTASAEAEDAGRSGRLLTLSVADSLQVLRTIEADVTTDDLGQLADHLAVDYLAAPPQPMLIRAMQARDQIITRLRDHHYRPTELRDLLVILARVQGVLTYAALDLGDSSAAIVHGDTAWALAERADDNELRAWVRGTQSLIARFDRRYRDAEQLVLDGLAYPTNGTGPIRLLAGLAQSRANLGDSAGANEALDAAERARMAITTSDTTSGLFTFSTAKQLYYAGSSLMWLRDAPDLDRAARDAQSAIEIWESSPATDRSLDDEALAHIYRATALVRLGDLDLAADALSPVLALPADRRISWIINRLGNVSDLLDDEMYAGSHDAAALRDEIANARP